ncbi:hypothetical protein [Actinotalea solisilvae]|uniref:hypothetical protein n=1 Tax=Actinotalea solisilvae TaxID=2072922 RepID=UPI0018F124AE|nr:hypothetical protein [Actinotalea solisilvae]
MGRHSAPAPPPASEPPRHDDGAGHAPATHGLVPRLVLAAVSGLTVAAVTLWGGTPWTTALALAAAAAVVVGVGAWLAGTLPRPGAGPPGPPGPPRPTPPAPGDGRDAHRPAGDQPVQ